MTHAQPLSPFEILGLPARFDTTAAEVAAAHMRVVAQHHPDRARSAMERDDFLRRSAEAGQAKQKLSEDIGRAEALLALHGVTADAVPLAPEFLAETLELRDRIEESTGQEHALADIAREVSAMHAQCMGELAEALRGLPTEGARARALLARLRYIQRMQARLRGD